MVNGLEAVKSISETKIKEERVLLKKKEQREASRKKYFMLKTVAKPTKGTQHNVLLYRCL